MKIKEYETAARPKSRNRKRHSPPSTSRSREGGRGGVASCIEKQKKIYKEKENIYGRRERRRATRKRHR